MFDAPQRKRRNCAEKSPYRLNLQKREWGRLIPFPLFSNHDRLLRDFWICRYTGFYARIQVDLPLLTTEQNQSVARLR